ncbi:NRIP3 [Branchiostoma lanceolatum]|uniref:NRIP3 protein n=1 Tax=Branchiostoma lanceolatum TaxID=7740 RepID=A0A8J9ZNA7_BRALA|nr:NRIP3 [Branchiostoma lanceolatum]
MSYKYDRDDIREAALKRQQKRLGHHAGFVHRDSSDLLPIDDLKKMGTVSKETQPAAIVQQKALKETFKRSDSGASQPGQRNRSMSQDATGTDALTVPAPRPRTGRRHHSCSDYDNNDSPSRLGGDNTLLFIKCKCNDHEVKAVVDTGNIFSVMSEETATTCGLKRLIDTETNGTVSVPDRAKKQWTVVGRLGRVPLAVGSRHAEANFIVIEERGIDLTFGLDILRKLKATVDLEQNTLILGGETVPFLQGREIPLKHRWGASSPIGL